MPEIASFFQHPLLGNESWSRSQRYNELLTEDGQDIGYHQGWDLVTPARFDPVTGDLVHMDRVGDVIRTMAAGEVVYSGNVEHGWGNTVIVQHDLGGGTYVVTVYAHLSERLVDSGDVAIGQPVGLMGNADGAHRTHLHLGMFLGEYNPAQDVYDFLGDGYLDDPDPDPTEGWINPETFLATHLAAPDENHIIGTDGDDSDVTAPGRTALYGSSIRDVISGLGGNDLVVARGGDDAILADTGSDTVRSGDGRDTVEAVGDGTDSFDGGSDVDLLMLDLSAVNSDLVIDLTEKRPTILGLTTVIENFERYDLETGGGNDIVSISAAQEPQGWSGGGGVDHAIIDFSGVSGDVTFIRTLPASGIISSIYVGGGAQVIGFARVDEFTIFSAAGNDLLDAQFMFSARLYGDSGNDTLRGTNGVDELYGGRGNDLIEGYNCLFDADQLYGGVGNDTLIGTGDGTWIDGGRGDDELTGGTGGVRYDRFVFRQFFGRDKITDFEAGAGSGDTIDLSALNLSLSGLKIRSADFGLSTKITVLATGDSILLQGVGIESLDVAHDLIL